MVDPSIIDTVRRYLRAVAEKGVPVSFGVIFGSQATGKTHRWSDIDLVVVSPKFDPTPDQEVISLLWRLTAHTDNRIEPIPCGERQWAEDDSSAIIEIARRQGEMVRPA